MFFFVKNLRVTQKYVHWPNNIHELHEERDFYDDVIMEQIPRYWLFVRGIHRWPVDSPHKGQWRGALICAWINVWTNNRNADDLRRHRDHYDVTVMLTSSTVVYPDGPLYMVPAILCHDMVISGFPAQRVSNAELTCCKPRYILKKKAVEWPSIWDAKTLMWHLHWYCHFCHVSVSYAYLFVLKWLVNYYY